MFRDYSLVKACVPVVVPTEACERFKRDTTVYIDSFDVQDFNKNEAGFIRNDISQLARAQSQSEYDSIMRRLVELRSDGSLPDDITDREAFDSIKPRYAQHMSDINAWLEMSNGSVMEKVNAAYEQALKDVKFDKSAGDRSPSSASE